MEWATVQQFPVLWKSILVGVIIGVPFDVYSGFWRGKRYRFPLFLSDCLFGALSAVITFFGALAISDGYLHPMIFMGVTAGWICEHWLIGRWLAWLFHKIHCAINKAFWVSKFILRATKEQVFRTAHEQKF